MHLHPTAPDTAVPPLGAPMRKRRRQLGLTLQGLADGAALSVGYLSQVERDKAVPTLATLAQIARALDVDLTYFIATRKPADAFSRAEGRARFAVAGSSVVYEAVSADYPGSDLSSYVLHVPAGYASEVVSHEGEELLFVLEGEIEQTLDGETFVMRAGDALHYAGSKPHSWTNRQASPARVLWTGMLSVLSQDGRRQMPLLATANDDA